MLDWHVPRLLEDCRVSSDYDRRRTEVDRYNEVSFKIKSVLLAGVHHFDNRSINGASVVSSSYLLNLGCVSSYLYDLETDLVFFRLSSHLGLFALAFSLVLANQICLQSQSHEPGRSVGPYLHGRLGSRSSWRD